MDAGSWFLLFRPFGMFPFCNLASFALVIPHLPVRHSGMFLAGIQKNTGCRIKSGMTEISIFNHQISDFL
jgi:hypothetical protein